MDTDEDTGVFQRLLGAFEGCFDQLESDLLRLAEDISEEGKDTTVGNMHAFLEWWCYFGLLERNGVHRVKASIPGLDVDGAGGVSTRAVSEYIQEKADTYGGKFARARRQFDYGFVKDSYLKCFLQSDSL